MPIAATKSKLIEIVNGQAISGPEKISIQGAEYDSRDIRGGELFVALAGENTHGNQYVPQALARGAALCLVEDPAWLKDKENGQRFIVVKDSLKAFWELAHWWRKERAVKVLAITGSVGKTTTKEIAAQLLLQHSKGVYSLKSHNNHVGVPYTLCRIGREHQWAVVEIGMNHPGEISPLAKMAAPDVAVVTIVAPAHLEALGTVEAVANEKFSIAEGLSTDGIIVFNADNPVSCQELNTNPAYAKLKRSSFGSADKADIKVTNIQANGLHGITFELAVDHKIEKIQMPILGTHNVANVAAAVCGVKNLFPDIDLSTIANGLKSFRAPLMRLNLKALTENRWLIDDSYNANPSSMGAALKFAADLKNSGSRVGLILGDMRELGTSAKQYHQSIAKQAFSLLPSFVVAVGEYSQLFVDEGKRCNIPAFAAENGVQAAHIATKLPFDILLVKASRGVKLDEAVKTLEERFGASLGSENN